MNCIRDRGWPLCFSSFVLGLWLSITSTATPLARVICRSLPHLFLLLISACFAAAQSNPIVVENAKPGNPPSQWDISGSGDPSIQGFATDISVNRGQTIRFKIKTNATNYRLDIYRLGYYNGLGARLVATVTPSVALPQTQPNPITNSSTGLIDCGNWAESASWAVPADATSGVYIAKLVRIDTGGASHIPFVVRDDSSTSDLFFQTSDTTWQAYNSWGGNSLYVGSPAGRAYKVSYNRPFITRAGETSYDWVFSAEYPMIRWLEANGYNVSYTTGVDTDRRGNLLTNHKVFLSVGHDEYWSGSQRANLEAARNAGVHLAFFSGNEVFWKTRWEASIDGSGTPYRTLVCYKETHAGAKIDPTSTWTGTWRDPRFSPPADGGRPENALTGTLFMVNGHRDDSISVPASYGAHRFWRNTSVATLTGSQVATFPVGTLGYEWDACPDNGVQPAGLMRLSSTTLSNLPLLQDYGSTYSSGQASHNLALYRHSSGALVFGAGTVQWAWGLDSTHDNGSAAADTRMKQATVNLFADMGAQAATLQQGLAPASKSTDATAPSSVITSPAPPTTLQNGVQVLVTGTAADSGGQVWAVEVSTDGGSTWKPAVGRGTWSFAWTPAASGSVTIKSRAVDDSGNMETPGLGVTVTVTGGQTTIWPSNAVPGVVDQGPDSAVELGVKFYSEVGGAIKGFRFYKSAGNTGSHVANLWSSTGTLLASTPFSNETASGWQQANFATPVPIDSATMYVASYHANNGHYSADENYFSSTGRDNPPLHAPASGGSWGSNGVYAYGSTSTFPNQTFNNTNYWVDVVLQAGPAPTLSSIAVTPANPTIATGATQQFMAMGTYSDGSTQNIAGQVTWNSSSTSVASITTGGLSTANAPGNTTISATQSGVTGNTTLTVQSTPLAITTSSLPNGAVNSAYSVTLAASGGTLPYTWSIASGSLPSGLALNSGSGAITGTPTSVGTFTFTARIVDTSTPTQSVTKEFVIAITNAPACYSKHLAVQRNSRRRGWRPGQSSGAGGEIPLGRRWKHHGDSIL